MARNLASLRREFRTDSGEEVSVYIDFPIESPEQDIVFSCRHGVVTKAKTFERLCYGTDGIQALYLALLSLNSMIDKLNSDRSQDNRIFWTGGMNKDDFGLPRYD